MTVFQIRGSKTFQEIDYAYPFTDRIYISKSDFEKMTSEITANFITATNIDPNDPILTSEPNALTELIKTIFQLSTSSAPELMNQEKRAFVFLSRNTDSAERLNALYNQSSKCDKDVIRSIINGYPPNPDLGCASGEMRCGGKLCMPIDWRCDGIRDCPDGSDERNCHFGCNNLNVWVPHYPCDFDRCFPWTERCDGKASCYDQSDERGCPPGCNKYEFRCDGLKCIPKSFLCDGVAQCEDETDEKHENCPCKNQGRPYFLVGTSTHPVPYLCDRGYPKIEESGRIRDLKERRYEKDNALSAIALLMLPSSISFFNPKDTSERPCLPKELLCESDSSWTDTAKHDCLDGADENPEHCQIYRKDQRCDGTEWACAVKPSQDDVRGCIPRRQWCDGRKNCHDASDENPAICRARDTDKCANMYKCRREVDYYATENNGNPQCIPNEWVCDGKQDCPGFKGWDEDSCSSHYQKFQRTEKIAHDIQAGFGKVNSVVNLYYQTFHRTNEIQPAALGTIRAESYFSCMQDAEYTVEACTNLRVTHPDKNAVYNVPRCASSGNYSGTVSPAFMYEFLYWNQWHQFTPLLQNIGSPLWKDQPFIPGNAEVYQINLAAVRTSSGSVAQIFI